MHKTISISKSNKEFVRKNYINLSRFVRKILDKINLNDDLNYQHFKSGVNLTPYDMAKIDEIREKYPKFNLSRYINDELLKERTKRERLSRETYSKEKLKQEITNEIIDKIKLDNSIKNKF
jgi:hypothetical protein